MAYQPDDPATIEAAQLAAYANRFEGKATGAEDFLGKLSRAEAAGVWTFEKRLQRISLDSVPNASSTYEALSNFATALGLSDGDGGYGPLKPTIATGLQGTATGVAGSPIAANTQLVAADGETIFETTALVNIGGGGSVTITFNATTAGTGGNLQTPATLTFVSPPAGVDASVTLTTGADNAIDAEDAAALLDRILLRLRFPPRGGAVQDYLQWPIDADEGITKVYAYPRRAGTGTFQVVVAYDGQTGIARRPTQTVVDSVNDYLDTVVPADLDGANIDIALRPYYNASNVLTVRVRGVVSDSFSWDWTDDGTYTVVSWTPATRKLEVNAAVPADFIAAVTAGSLPRVQVLDTGGAGEVVPAQLRVEALTVGNTVLTLTAASIPAGFNPQATDRVYAGSTFAAEVAQDVLDYIDTRGPSKASGYVDEEVDPWDDVVGVFQIARVALDAADEDGVRYLENLIATPTIAVGAGAPAATDYQPPDNSTDPPEIAVAKFVVCTQ